MQEDMEHCRRKELEWGVELECLFNICRRYWAMLQADVIGYEFEKMTEEIKFFKDIKPKFISEIIYCGLLSHAKLFKSSINDAEDLKKFWHAESLRLEKFRWENFIFYEYYKTGRTDKDWEWFTRENNDLRNFLSAGPYDLDEKASTSHDGLVSNLLAQERYVDYLKKEMKALHGA